MCLCVLCADSSHSSSSSTKGERRSTKMRSLPGSNEPYEASSPKELGAKASLSASNQLHEMNCLKLCLIFELFVSSLTPQPPISYIYILDNQEHFHAVCISCCHCKPLKCKVIYNSFSHNKETKRLR